MEVEEASGFSLVATALTGSSHHLIDPRTTAAEMLRGELRLGYIQLCLLFTLKLIQVEESKG